MAKPWSLSESIAQMMVVRRACGHAVGDIADSYGVSPSCVYNILNGANYSEATKCLRWQGRKLLNEAKRKYARRGSSLMDERLSTNPKTFIREIVRADEANTKAHINNLKQTILLVEQENLERAHRLQALSECII